MKDTPFIYTFSNPIGYFLYDVNTNQIVKIKKDFYFALTQCLNSGNQEYKQFVEYNQMKQLGLLSSNRPEIIENPMSEYASTYLGSCLKSLILQVTQRCNLRCGYCYFSGNGKLTRRHTNLDMSWDIAKAAIDFFAAHSAQSDEVTLSFYGGEPLLAFPIISKCVEYAESVMFDKIIHYSITTNGTVFNDEIVSFLQKHNFYTLLSIDGPEKVHNMFRRFASDGRGSFEKVYSNLSFINENYPDYFRKIEINAVVSRDRDYFEAIRFFNTDSILSKLKVYMNRVSDNLIENNYSATVQYSCTRKTQRLKALLDSVQGYDDNISMRDDESVFSIKSKFEKTELLTHTFHHNGPCIPGYENVFIDVFGRFFPCVNASELSETSFVGSLEKGFDMKKVEEFLNIGKISEDRCKDCECMRFCSICPLSIDNNDCFSAELKEQRCEQIMHQFEDALKKYVIYNEIGAF